MCVYNYLTLGQDVGVCKKALNHVSVYVFVCPCQRMLFLLSPLAVCVCVIIQRGPL